MLYPIIVSNVCIQLQYFKRI